MCMIYRILPLLVVGVAMGEETESLPPMVVTGDKLNVRENHASGANVVLDAEAIDAAPAGAGTYQDLFALFAGAYAGNPGIGTFSMRGLNQDNVFNYLGTG